MKSKKLLSAIFLLLIAASNLLAQDLKVKKRVAVFLFENKTSNSYSWWHYKNPGEGMSDMLTTQLVKSGEYRVIEREEINKIIQEQKLGISGAVTEQSAAKIGKLLGVEIAIMGSVTEFGYQDKSKSVGGFKLKVGMKNLIATVAVDIRMIDTSTGEIIAAEHIRKSKSEKGVKLGLKSKSVNSQSDFDETLVGEVTNQAITDAIGVITSNSAKVAWSAKVIMEKSGHVYINAGNKIGLKKGDILVIYSAGETLIDPDTGISLGSMETKIGQIKVENPNVGDGKASQCSIISGEGFKKGDIVKLK